MEVGGREAGDGHEQRKDGYWYGKFPGNGKLNNPKRTIYRENPKIDHQNKEHTECQTGGDTVESKRRRGQWGREASSGQVIRGAWLRGFPG